jgi:hypothetical protein
MKKILAALIASLFAVGAFATEAPKAAEKASAPAAKASAPAKAASAAPADKK